MKLSDQYKNSQIRQSNNHLILIKKSLCLNNNKNNKMIDNKIIKITFILRWGPLYLCSRTYSTSTNKHRVCLWLWFVVVCYLPISPYSVGLLHCHWVYLITHWGLVMHIYISKLTIIISDHYSDVTMGMMASQVTGVSIVCSTVCSGTHQRKHQSSVSLAFVRGIHRWLVNSLHKWQ